MSARGLILIIGAGGLAWFAAMKATGPRTVAKMPGQSEGGLMNYISGMFSKVSSAHDENYASAYNARGYQYAEYIAAMERKYNIPRDLLMRQAWAESSFKPTASNPSGARGMFQFMPATAQWLNVIALDWRSSADGAGRYMAYLYNRFKSWPLALAAYNWGEGNVAKAINGERTPPAETRDYVQKIVGADLLALIESTSGGASV